MARLRLSTFILLAMMPLILFLPEGSPPSPLCRAAELPPTGVEFKTALTERYLTFLCRQSGLATSLSPDADHLPRCDTDEFGPGEWLSIAKAGLNDIDRRCDAYLAWLFDRERTKSPILERIDEASTATQAILKATQSGNVALSIIAQAFDLLEESPDNRSSRLLLEIEKSTIQSVVQKNRDLFRGNLKDGWVTGKPHAVTAMRNYLRLCMPSEIEAQINRAISGGPAPAKTPSAD
jgi:hypothetical protein